MAGAPETTHMSSIFSRCVKFKLQKIGTRGLGGRSGDQLLVDGWDGGIGGVDRMSPPRRICHVIEKADKGETELLTMD